jgi:SAM-dependent methyltransferase
MSYEIESFGDYRCIDCMAALRQSADGLSCACENCSRSYPVVQHIPVLTSRPNVLLRSHHQKVVEARTDLEKRTLNLRESASGRQPPDRLQRIDRMLHGMAHNIELIEKIMRPVTDHVTCGESRPFEAVDWILSHNTGLGAMRMFIYFYQDWARTTSFESAESLIVNALLQHRPDSDAVAVLGAGGCGIAKACAAHFSRTYAIDLSMPALLLAQKLLEGKSVSIFVGAAGWQPVCLTPPRPTTDKIGLVAADVSRLPFADGSMSVVVTQYLMDLVGNPLAVAREIGRILKSSGVWINFSVPFSIPGDPLGLTRPGIPEVCALLAPLGFEVVEGRSEQVNHLNLDGLQNGGHRQAHEAHFVVARKNASGPAADTGWGAVGSDDVWWRHVPRVVPGMDVQIVRKRVFSSAGPAQTVEFQVNQMSASFPPRSMDLLESLFCQIDGKRTLREALNGLALQGVVVGDGAFREMVQHFRRELGVLTLQ